MKIKSVIKYQLWSVMKAFVIFYFIMLLIRCAGIFFGLAGEGKLHMSGTEVNSIVFMGFLGTFTFLEDFRFLIQNGYSRKSMVASFLIEFIIVAALLSGVDMIIERATRVFFEYDSLFTQLYGSAHLIYQFIWGLLINLSIGLLTFLVTVVCMRVNKQKLIFLVLVPILIISIVPILEMTVTNGAIVAWLIDTVQLLFGFTKQGISYLNPVVSLCVVSLFFLGVSYLAVRRAPIQG